MAIQKLTGSEPAYPIGEAEKDRLDQYPNISYPGLSIRQQFAMAAMQSVISWCNEHSSIEQDCELAVKYADALITELNRTEADNV